MTANNDATHDANHISDDDLVLFALQLLPEERMTQTMSHLLACPHCRAEVANIQGDLAAYSMAAEPAPLPAGSRDRFMRQIAREPRSTELPAFALTPTEYELRQNSRQNERIEQKQQIEQKEKLTLTPESDFSAAAEERVQDRFQERRQERVNQERANNQERTNQERTNQERADQERANQERADQERADRERADRERARDRVHERIEDRATEDRAVENRAHGLSLTDSKSSDRRSSEPVFSARQSRTLTRGTRQDDSEDVEVYREDRRRPRRAPWVLAWTGWAVAAGCSFVAGLQLHQRQQIQSVIATQQAKIDDVQKQVSGAQQAQEAVSTLTAATAMQVALHATPAARPAIATKGAPPVIAPEALAAYLADKGALVFIATHMAPAPAGKTYELWLLPANGQGPIPAGTFKPDAQGSASVMLPTLPKGVQAKGFGVTVENDGGSATPTLPIVMS